MANTAGMCTSFKGELFAGLHRLLRTGVPVARSLMQCFAVAHELRMELHLLIFDFETEEHLHPKYPSDCQNQVPDFRDRSEEHTSELQSH